MFDDGGFCWVRDKKELLVEGKNSKEKKINFSFITLKRQKNLWNCQSFLNKFGVFFSFVFENN